MEKKCKTCANFDSSSIKRKRGNCKDEFVFSAWDDEALVLIYSENLEDVYVSEDFGCVNWKERITK